MSKGILTALMGAFCLLTFNTARAFGGDYTPGTTPMVVDAGLSGGGDKLVTLVYTNGDTNTIYAGDGLFGDFGIQQNFADSHWSIKATAGFDYWAASASNATISFTRYPLDVLALYNIGDSHLGFGLTEHLSPKLNNDGFAPDASFDNATGVMLQYQYWLFGARLTSIRYKLSSGCAANCSFSGNSLSLFFDYAF